MFLIISEIIIASFCNNFNESSFFNYNVNFKHIYGYILGSSKSSKSNMSPLNKNDLNIFV